jgi:hypothetical protein
MEKATGERRGFDSMHEASHWLKVQYLQTFIIGVARSTFLEVAEPNHVLTIVVGLLLSKDGYLRDV